MGSIERVGSELGFEHSAGHLASIAHGKHSTFRLHPFLYTTSKVVDGDSSSNLDCLPFPLRTPELPASRADRVLRIAFSFLRRQSAFSVFFPVCFGVHGVREPAALPL